MIAKDGYRVILYTGVLFIILLVLALEFSTPLLWTLSILSGSLFIFHFFFFRNPERQIPTGERLVLSPADGRVIKIEEVEEPRFLEGKARRVSIFMSVFNVHVNRMPVSGKIAYVDYRKGRFLAAYADEALEMNEQNAIGVEGLYGRLLFIQIAGLIARRIVCHASKGDRMQAGQRFGMIKYSSRVDIYLPMSVKIHVGLKEKVKGGITVIGEFES